MTTRDCAHRTYSRGASSRNATSDVNLYYQNLPGKDFIPATGLIGMHGDAGMMPLLLPAVRADCFVRRILSIT